VPSTIECFELRIKSLEGYDLIFEFAFPERPMQDESGEKGIEGLAQNIVFHVEREPPQSSPRKFVCF
jgi:hypothetical protein